MIIYANSQDPTYNEFNNFLLHYGYLVAIGAAVLVAIIAVTLLLLQRNKKKEAPIEKVYSSSGIYEALGGKDNIISTNKAGSRISLVMKDYSKVDEAKLNSLGVDSIIKMSNKITLVVKDDPDSFYKLFD